MHVLRTAASGKGRMVWVELTNETITCMSDVVLKQWLTGGVEKKERPSTLPRAKRPSEDEVDTQASMEQESMDTPEIVEIDEYQ